MLTDADPTRDEDPQFMSGDAQGTAVAMLRFIAGSPDEGVSLTRRYHLQCRFVGRRKGEAEEDPWVTVWIS